MTERRYDTTLAARFDFGAEQGEGTIENASPRGVFVNTRTIPRRGEKIWLCFEDLRGRLLEATGVVWWTTRDASVGPLDREGFGVRLVATGKDYRRLLRKLSRRDGGPQPG